MANSASYTSLPPPFILPGELQGREGRGEATCDTDRDVGRRKMAWWGTLHSSSEWLVEAVYVFDPSWAAFLVELLSTSCV